MSKTTSHHPLIYGRHPIMLANIYPSETFDESLSASQNALRAVDIIDQHTRHVSSPDNFKYKALGNFEVWHLDQTSQNELHDLKEKINTLGRLPHVVESWRVVHADADAADLFCEHVARRARAIINTAYPNLMLHCGNYFNRRQEEETRLPSWTFCGGW